MQLPEVADVEHMVGPDGTQRLKLLSARTLRSTRLPPTARSRGVAERKPMPEEVGGRTRERARRSVPTLPLGWPRTHCPLPRHVCGAAVLVSGWQPQACRTTAPPRYSSNFRQPRRKVDGTRGPSTSSALPSHWSTGDHLRVQELPLTAARARHNLGRWTAIWRDATTAN